MTIHLGNAYKKQIVGSKGPHRSEAFELGADVLALLAKVLLRGGRPVAKHVSGAKRHLLYAYIIWALKPILAKLPTISKSDVEVVRNL